MSTVYALKNADEFCITNIAGKEKFIQHCPKYGTCSIEIHKQEAKHPIWHWDGNYESPTISPSIGCDHRCGKHVSVINGDMQ